MFVLSVWVLVGSALLFSLIKNKEKTVNSLVVAWKFFRSMASPVLITLWAIGFLLAFIPPSLISRTVGQESWWRGVVMAAIFGSIVLIQAFIAFPLAGSLLRQGASISAIAAFVTTLVMVGVITAPLEIKFFGKKFTFLRNFLSFIFAIIIALIIGTALQ